LHLTILKSQKIVNIFRTSFISKRLNNVQVHLIEMTGSEWGVVGGVGNRGTMVSPSVWGGVGRVSIAVVSQRSGVISTFVQMVSTEGVWGGVSGMGVRPIGVGTISSNWSNNSALVEMMSSVGASVGGGVGTVSVGTVSVRTIGEWSSGVHTTFVEVMITLSGTKSVGWGVSTSVWAVHGRSHGQ